VNIEQKRMEQGTPLTEGEKQQFHALREWAERCDSTLRSTSSTVAQTSKKTE